MFFFFSEAETYYFVKCSAEAKTMSSGCHFAWGWDCDARWSTNNWRWGSVNFLITHSYFFQDDGAVSIKIEHHEYDEIIAEEEKKEEERNSQKEKTEAEVEEEKEKKVCNKTNYIV